MEHQNPYERDDLATAYEAAYNLFRLMATGDNDEPDLERNIAFERGIMDAKADVKAEHDERQGLIENA